MTNTPQKHTPKKQTPKKQLPTPPAPQHPWARYNFFLTHPDYPNCELHLAQAKRDIRAVNAKKGRKIVKYTAPIVAKKENILTKIKNKFITLIKKIFS